MFEDDRFVVFPDISPAAKVHLLVITKVLFPLFFKICFNSTGFSMQEHIKDVQSLSADDIPMIKDMKEVKHLDDKSKTSS